MCGCGKSTGLQEMRIIGVVVSLWGMRDWIFFSQFQVHGENKRPILLYHDGVHRQTVLNWPFPRTRFELSGCFWLTTIGGA